MAKQKEGFRKAAEEFYQYHPQEVLLKEKNRNKSALKLGLPKELEDDEKRILLRPDAVAILVNNGFEVIVEKGAGKPSHYHDHEYAEAGATIVDSHQEALEADIILKISPPTIDEIKYIKSCKTVLSTLHSSTVSKEYLKAINKKKITSIAFELIEDKVGGLPLVHAMSEIAGSTVMLIAAEFLSSFNEGRGIILGGITGVPPSKVVILGAGTVAEYAARTALGMGAEVKVFDNHIYKLRRLKEKLDNFQLYTSAFDTAMLQDALERADVAIGAIYTSEGRTPSIVTEEMVASMKHNSIIVDVSIDQGGCFETSEATTHKNPVYKKFDVIHYCVPNIASRVSRTATAAISNIFTPILSQLIESGSVDQMMRENPWFTKGVYTYGGNVTNQVIANKFDLSCKNLELILAARI